MRTRIGRKSRGLVLGLLVATPIGCVSPTDPPAPPGGGQEFELSYDGFQQSVAPVFAGFGCNAVECHGGGIRGTFQLSLITAPDPAFDFEQAALQVDPYDPSASKLLVKPLVVAAGGLPHSHEPFTSTADAGYQAILDWILAGEFE